MSGLPHAGGSIIAVQPVINQHVGGLSLEGMKALPRWVAWRLDLRNGKTTKVPYGVRGENAKSDDPNTWLTYEAAERLTQTLPNALGVGIMLGDLGDGKYLSGIDLDTCRNADGDLEPWAVEVMQRFRTYGEVSPSGTGVKLLLWYPSSGISFLRKHMGGAEHGKQWKRRGDGGDHPPAIEMYLSNRFFAVTWQQVEWLPGEVHKPQQDALLRLIEKDGPAFAGATKPKAADDRQPDLKDAPPPPPGDGDDIWTRIRAKSRFSQPIRRLLAGDFSGMADSSRSGIAFLLAGVMSREGFSREDYIEAVSTYTHTRNWYREKGNILGGREVNRAWQKASEPPPRQDPPHDEDGVVNEPKPGKSATSHEDGVALDFAAHYQGIAAFDHTDQQWLLWQDDRWQRDQTKRVEELARDFVRETRLGLDKAPVAMTKIAFARAVESAARADRRIAASHEQWNADPWLIGVPGGIVALRTGTLLDPDSTAYISRQASVRPAPAGTPCPMWQAFLDATTGGDKDLQGFLQRFAGYCLTGDVTEEVLTFIYGPGGNGKGVYMDTLAAILDEYAVGLPIEAFTANTNTNLDYYRAQMAGARLVTASETEAGTPWRESMIKQLTGNEHSLSARQPYGRAFTFKPIFKLAIVGNHAPTLRGRTPAMERRLRIVPFTHTPPKPDHGLKDRLKTEYPAIFRWMIEGCLMWQRDRLGTCGAIQKATDDYFQEQDKFSRWLDECFTLVPSGQVRAGIFYNSFRDWCSQNGEDPVKNQEFGEMLKKYPKIYKKKSDGIQYIQGVMPKKDDSTNQDRRYGE